MLLDKIDPVISCDSFPQCTASTHFGHTHYCYDKCSKDNDDHLNSICPHHCLHAALSININILLIYYININIIIKLINNEVIPEKAFLVLYLAHLTVQV